MTPSFRGVCAWKLAEKLRGVSRRVFAEFLREISRRKKKNGLRELTELTRNLAEFSSRNFAFENIFSRSEREKIAFFLV